MQPFRRAFVALVLAATPGCKPLDEPAKPARIEPASITTLDEPGVKACNATGKLYDALDAKCRDDLSLATWACTRAGLAAHLVARDVLQTLASSDKTSLDALDAQLAAGYELHQCGEGADGSTYLVTIKRTSPNASAVLAVRHLYFVAPTPTAVPEPPALPPAVPKPPAPAEPPAPPPENPAPAPVPEPPAPPAPTPPAPDGGVPCDGEPAACAPFLVLGATTVNFYEQAVHLREMTKAGRTAKSVLPIQGRVTQVATVSATELFGLTVDAIVSINVDTGESGLPIKATYDVPGLSAPSGLAYDTKRNLIVVAGSGLTSDYYTYAPATQKWTFLGSLGIELGAVAYDAARDRIVGLKMDPSVNTVYSYSDLVFVDPTSAAITSTIPLDTYIVKPNSGLDSKSQAEQEASVQMRIVDGKALVIRSLLETTTQIFAIDLDSGAVSLTHRSGREIEHPVSIPDDHYYGSCTSSDASLYATEPLPPGDKLLHVIALRDGRTEEEEPLDVLVTETRRPVQLFLSSHDAMKWNVIADPGVTIDKIFVHDFPETTAVIAPSGTTIERVTDLLTFATSWEWGAYTDFYDFITAVRQRTGLTEAGFQGCSTGLGFEVPHVLEAYE